MTVRNPGLCFLALLILHSAALADYSIVSSKSDLEPRVGLGATGPNGVYTTTASTTASNVRIGISGAASNRVYGNAAFMFQLPILAPGQTITGASFKVLELIDSAAGDPAANADLWAIGFDNNNNPPLNSATESQAYFFNGANDTSGGVGGVARALLQDNFLVHTDVITSGSAAAHQISSPQHSSPGRQGLILTQGGQMPIHHSSPGAQSADERIACVLRRWKFLVTNQNVFDSRATASTMRPSGCVVGMADKAVRPTDTNARPTEVRMESRPVSRFSGRRIHFIGIGGCGMSGLARVLLDAGAIVSGSDIKLNPQMTELGRHGVLIADEQVGTLLRPDIDLVVRTAAVPENNAEYRAACGMGLRQMKYAHLLGEVMAERLGVAVSGTHGKTTTTSMISHALLQCGADPSFVIGGTVAQLGGSSRSGMGQSFVVEACEFDRSFHSLWPQVAVITNIEEDHLDCYPGGIAEIVESFRIFAQRVPIDGRIIANGQDDSVRKALEGLNAPVSWVGFDDLGSLDWAVSGISMGNGCYRGEVSRHGKRMARLNLSVPGRHNLFNATAALAACEACGVDVERAAEAIGGFLGADRRMTEMGQSNGAMVVDDYGHHPTEIRTTLRALREKYHPRRLICVFQPHQHSRTRFLLDDFAASFCDADLTMIPEIYSVRDSDADRSSVSTQDLVERIERHGQRALFVPQLSQIVTDLRREVGLGDLVVTMGAGNVCDVGRELVGG